MKALSLKEPWITLVAGGRKTIETRKWKTGYRGQLLLVGSKNPPGRYAGKAACVAELYECRPMLKGDEKEACYEWHRGAYSWPLRNIRKVKPFPVKGRLGFYDVPDALVEF